VTAAAERPCLDDDAAAAYVHGLLAATERDGVERHLDGCAECREVVSALAGTSYLAVAETAPSPPGRAGDATPLLRAGDTLGRYFIVERLGAGGMGVVYAAYDPKLDRKIAVKLLRPPSIDGGVAVDDERLLREAQALARLSHPNVVAVHDVGSIDDAVFIAMELVDGVTLGDWLAQTRRSWREIVAVLAAAGRGLAAAHDAGLVHRDVKPGNVLVGRAGDVKVTDFGLARAAGSASVADELTASPEPRWLEQPLTATGAVMGTPAYMAPEQLAGADADARSDQFGFCVTAWEALYGARPFAGRTVAELAAAVAAQRIDEPGRAGAVPARLRKLLTRGLRADPAHRFPSMTALLDALLRDRSRSRRWAVAAASVTIAAATIFLFAGAHGAATPPCRDAARKLDGVWDRERAAAVRDAFAATGLVQAGAAADQVIVTLDAFADQWAAQRTEACEATHVHGEQSANVLDRRMTCLDRALANLDATTDILAAADAQVIAASGQLASSLPRLASCGDVAGLLEQVVPADPAIRARAEELHREFARQAALRNAGKYENALRDAQQLVRDAEPLGDAGLLASALTLEASAQRLAGDLDAAAASLHRAAWAADAGNHRRSRALALLALVELLGHEGDRPADAAVWAGYAEAAVAACRDHELDHELAHVLGAMHERRGDAGAALGHRERGLKMAIELYGADSQEAAVAHGNLATTLLSLGRYDDAERHLSRASALYRARYDGDHPELATIGTLLASVLYERGEQLRAIEQLRAALALKRRWVGEDQVDTGIVEVNLGTVLADAGQLDEAEAHLERARAIFATRLGAEHPHLASVFAALANVHLQRGEAAETVDRFERAIAIEERSLGAAHPSLAATRSDYGAALLVLGRPRQALEQQRRATAALTTAFGAAHQSVGAARLRHGQALAALRQPAAARSAFESAVSILEAGEDLTTLADARYELARILWTRAADRARARRLATLAHEHLAQLPVLDAQQRAAMKWLAAHDDDYRGM
jgi:tetratricopeptide (TPR) repeat protein